MQGMSSQSRACMTTPLQSFANGSDLNAALFDAYVTGPAITNAWTFR